MAIGEALGYYLEEHPKEAKIIVDKVILAAQARHAARKARELVTIWITSGISFSLERSI